jgi:hypothetical protein
MQCFQDVLGSAGMVSRLTFLHFAHNPKVGGSNPPPATNLINQLQTSGRENRLTIDSQKETNSLRMGWFSSLSEKIDSQSTHTSFSGHNLLRPEILALHSIVAALLAADPQP